MPTYECVKCGYKLHGWAEPPPEKCPECGGEMRLVTKEGEEMETYQVTLLVNGYIQFRVKAKDEDEAIEKAELRLGDGMKEASVWKYDLAYTDSPDVEIIQEK